MRNAQVRKDWETLVQNRRSACTACWDHNANTPTTRIGKRYEPLKGTQSHVDFQDETLRQWQYEIDNGARVKVGVGATFVVVMSVSTGHPKENE